MLLDCVVEMRVETVPVELGTLETLEVVAELLGAEVELATELDELVVVVAWAALEELAVVVAAPGAEMERPLPTVLTLWHCDFAGAGCAAGVLGWPWWNVEVP